MKIYIVLCKNKETGVVLDINSVWDDERKAVEAAGNVMRAGYYPQIFNFEVGEEK